MLVGMLSLMFSARLLMIIQSLIHRRGVVLRTLHFLLLFDLVVFPFQTAPMECLTSKHSFPFSTWQRI